MYDVTNRSSFDVLSDWLSELRNNLANPTDMDSIVFVVCANKVINKHYMLYLWNVYHVTY